MVILFFILIVTFFLLTYNGFLLKDIVVGHIFILILYNNAIIYGVFVNIINFFSL